MLTIQDVGSEAVYKAALAESKKGLPFIKKLLKKKVTRQEAMNMKALELRNVRLDNLDFLVHFPSLKELEITNSGIGNYDGLQFCAELTYFAHYLEGEATAYGIRDISFLHCLPQLEVLCLTGHKIEDVSTIAGLSKVRHLILEGNPVKTIEPLKEMPNLEQLELEDCKLNSLDGLAEFKSLKTICAEGNCFTAEQQKEYHEKYPHIDIDFNN